MAYPRNAASPPPVAIGAVVQISDGAVQTTGVTVYHRTSSTTENSGGGTTNVGATTGTIYYTPTQAETNYESFELVAWKTGCIPACVTVVTSASATAGKVVLSGETHTSAVIPTVTTLTGHTAQTGDCYARLGAPAGASHAADVAAVKSDTAAVKAKTDNLPTDPADQSAVEAAITAATSTLATAANLATVAGYLDTEIAAILADTDELQKAITDGGRTDLLIDAIKAKTDLMPSAATISTQVASDLAAAHGAGSWATATGFSTHSAADVVTALGTGSTLTALATAASQVTIASYIDTEVAAILAAVDTEVAAIKAKTDNLPSDPANQSDVEAAIVALLTTQMTESYNATGVAPTVAQALFVIMQRLTEFGITGTTIGVKKLNRVDSAYSLTTDDATNPTSSTRTP